jgi:probable HAF family extracellular repeat protein
MHAHTRNQSAPNRLPSSKLPARIVTMAHRIHMPWLGRFTVIAASIVPLMACLSGGGGESLAPVAVFVPLGSLSGYTMSQAVAVSSNGSVVVGTASTAAGNRQAFRWTAQQGMAGLGFIASGTYSAAAAVSADGSVILGNGDSATAPATPAGVFRWTANAGAIRLDSPAGAYLCSGGGLSGDGAIVAGTCLQFNNEAFRWTDNAAPVGLGRFGGGSNQTSSATAISGDGAVIVGAGHPVLTGAVMWAANGAAAVLGKLPGDASAYAVAVSHDGAVIVGTSQDSVQNARAFRWTQDAGMEALGAAPSGVLGTFVASISGDGTTVVGGGPTNNGDVALIWDAGHGWRLLDAALAADYRLEIPGWTLARATAIAEDGHTIAGYGTNALGQTEAWIVQLPH